ncbi:energy-coupling factor ABC transporter substrate-binding protein [Lutibacter sp.]|uniref:energy-coupling factor ABC transporter substrate-binding protein n=1 Tax=Lutibacter sp. TaxID=1925666 RepID=UPI0035636BC6
MKNKKSFIIISLLVAGLLIALQFVLANVVSKFEGTDDQAVAIISEISPNYKPWAFSFWEPSGAMAETILFAVQTTLGLSVIVFYLINRNSKLKRTKCN